MRILIITHYFPPHHGGIENVAAAQAQLLTGLGHEVRVVTSKIPSDRPIDHEDFSVVRVPANNILERRLGVPFPLFHPRAAAILGSEAARADVVNGHGHVYMPVVLGALWARILRKPFVLTQHNTFVWYESSLLRAVQHAADMTLGRWTIACAASTVAVSKASLAYLGTIAPVSGTVIYNGVDTRRFSPSEDRDQVRLSLSIPLKKTVCLCVRRITFKNGIDTLLEAAELLRSRTDIFFLIGGDGPDLPLAREIVEDRGLENVALLGSIRAPELSAYYAASDMFILPSKTGEGLPLVVLEALSTGLPVIATRSGGHVEIIHDGGLGFLAEPGDAAGIAQRIASLAGQPALLASMKERARDFAVQSLSWEHNVAQLLAVLRAVV